MKLSRAPALILAAALIAGCGSGGIVERTGSVAGRDFEVRVKSADVGSSRASSLASEAKKILEERFKDVLPDRGVIGELNEKRSVSGLKPELIAMIAAAESLRVVTNGFYDYRMGAVSELWKFDDRRPAVPDEASVLSSLEAAQAMSLEVEGDRATLTGSGKIDFGDLALGWAVDGAAEALVAGGAKTWSVKLGRLVRFQGWGEDEAYLIPIPPAPGDSIWTPLYPPDGAFSLYHPSIDGFDYRDAPVARLFETATGLPPDTIIAAGGWSEDGLRAGALGTALVGMGRRLAFEWMLGHQPAGMFVMHIEALEGAKIVETSDRFFKTISDSLPPPK